MVITTRAYVWAFFSEFISNLNSCSRITAYIPVFISSGMAETGYAGSSLALAIKPIVIPNNKSEVFLIRLLFLQHNLLSLFRDDPGVKFSKVRIFVLNK